jgi:serine protease inhibitor
MKTGIGFTLAKRFGLGLLIISITSHSLAAAVTETDADSIAPAVNALGIEIYHSTTAPSVGNMVMSPYSIQTALAMAYAGADGDTKAEMGRVLHLSGRDETIAEGFAAFQQRLTMITEESS